MDLAIATRNHGKMREMAAALDIPGLRVLTPAEAGEWPEVEETGATFQENAVLKAEALRDLKGAAALADDSGLMVDALAGEPGVRSSRYAGPEGDSEKNMDLLLERLAGVPPLERTARFACVMALALTDGELVITRGELEGSIAEARRGSGGFGYDPVFVPLGYERTLAELSLKEKNAISHRGKALSRMRVVLAGLIEGR